MHAENRLCWNDSLLLLLPKSHRLGTLPTARTQMPLPFGMEDQVDINQSHNAFGHIRLCSRALPLVFSTIARPHEFFDPTGIEQHDADTVVILWLPLRAKPPERPAHHQVTSSSPPSAWPRFPSAWPRAWLSPPCSSFAFSAQPEQLQRAWPCPGCGLVPGAASPSAP